METYCVYLKSKFYGVQIIIQVLSRGRFHVKNGSYVIIFVYHSRWWHRLFLRKLLGATEEGRIREYAHLIIIN